mgnify:CR=1 FL=1
MISKADPELTSETQDVYAQAYQPTQIPDSITNGKNSVTGLGFQTATGTNCFLSPIPVESGDQFPILPVTDDTISFAVHDTTYTMTTLLGDSVQTSNSIIGSVADEAAFFLEKAEKIIKALFSLW